MLIWQPKVSFEATFEEECVVLFVVFWYLYLFMMVFVTFITPKAKGESHFFGRGGVLLICQNLAWKRNLGLKIMWSLHLPLLLSVQQRIAGQTAAGRAGSSARQRQQSPGSVEEHQASRKTVNTGSLIAGRRRGEADVRKQTQIWGASQRARGCLCCCCCSVRVSDPIYSIILSLTPTTSPAR